MRISTLLLAAACAAPLAPAQTVEQPGKVYVGNQGGFGANTSSITVFDGGGETQLFRGQLGSVVQSTTVIGDRLYIMSDEAGRIDVVDIGTDARVAQITSPDVTTVRYMAEAAPGKAYVTQLYLPDGSFSGGSVAVVDLETNTFASVINDDSFSNPEGIAVVGGRAFVANSGFGSSTTLTVLDVASDAVTGTVELGCSARAVLPDDNDGEVYAFCSDEVVVVTAATGTVATRIRAPEAILPLGTGGLGQDAALLAPNRGPVGAPGEYTPGDMAAVGTGGVLLVNSETEEATPLSIPGERSISAIGLLSGLSTSLDDIEVRELYLGRPATTSPFSTDGIVTVHSLADGSLIDSFAAGVYPTSVSISTVFVTDTEPAAAAAAFAITGLFPNPVANQATVAFTLDQATSVSVRVFDVLGREVLADERTFAAGQQQLDLDAAALPSGLYVVRLSAERQVATTRFTVAR
jgi:hypothetical protein